jgi:xanthine dehydrogenase accessory factor
MCAEMSEGGEPFATVTFLVSRGSAPQDAGSKMIVTGEGLRWGTVGGGKLEAQAIEEARAMLDATAKGPAQAPRTRLIEWDLGPDLGMTCGGGVSLFIEVHNAGAWEIAIFGAGHVAQALVPMLLTLGCRITCIDKRTEWLERLPKTSRVRAIQSDNPPDEVPRLPDGTFLVSVTPGHEHDLAVLRAAFESGREFPYLGCIGSKRKAATLQKALHEAGMPDTDIERLHCPIGLPIGTNAPPEIAISIAAQLLQERDKAKTL